MDTFKLEIPSNIYYLEIATSFLRIVGRYIPNQSEKFLDEMEVVVSEACTNAIKHSEKQDGNAIKILFIIHKDSLEMQVINPGQNKNIDSIFNPEINFNSEGRGNGAFIMKSLTNEMKAENRVREFQLTLKKNY